MKIYVCQSSPSCVDANLRDMMIHVSLAAQQDCDFAVFPAMALSSPVEFIDGSRQSYRPVQLKDEEDVIIQTEKAVDALHRHLISLGKPMRVIFGGLYSFRVRMNKRYDRFNAIYSLSPDSPPKWYAQRFGAPHVFDQLGGNIVHSEKIVACNRGQDSVVTASYGFIEEAMSDVPFNVPNASVGVIFLLQNGDDPKHKKLLLEELSRQTKQHVICCNSSYGGSMIVPAPTGSRIYTRTAVYFGQEVMIADLCGMGTHHDILDVNKPIQYEHDFEEKPPKVTFPWSGEISIPHKEVEIYTRYMTVVQDIKNRCLSRVVIPCETMAGYVLTAMAVHALGADKVTILLPPKATNPLELESVSFDWQHWVTRLLMHVPAESRYAHARDISLFMGFTTMLAKGMAAGTGGSVLWPSTRSQRFFDLDDSGCYEPLSNMLYSDVATIARWLNGVNDKLVPPNLIAADPLSSEFGTWQQFDECIRLIVDDGYSLDQVMARKAGTLRAMQHLIGWRTK